MLATFPSTIHFILTCLLKSIFNLLVEFIYLLKKLQNVPTL